MTYENISNGKYKYFFELETIEPSVNGNTSFSYYYGYVYIQNENGEYKISHIDLKGADFLCTAYHGWRNNAEFYVDTVYGHWCNLIKKDIQQINIGILKIFMYLAMIHRTIDLNSFNLQMALT